MNIQLTFHGAAQTVTGSKYLVEFGSSKYLIDCGLFQGLKNLRLKNWAPFDFLVKDLKAVLLTHAHLDHSGAIPLLLIQGYKGPIYSTQATKDLCAILLPDSGYLQEEDARFANLGRYSKHHPALPLYTEEDGRLSLAYFKVSEYFSNLQIEPHVMASFIPAGHILGASQVLLNLSGYKILFSGDLGRPNDPVMKAPEPPLDCNVLVLESTYGDRVHKTEDPKIRLKQIVNDTIKRGGTLLIPVFAVGRAQTILYLLHELRENGDIPEVPIYLNSPMAIDAHHIFEQHCDEHKVNRDLCFLVSRGVKLIRTPAESLSLQEIEAPKIILSASGMATGGRVLHHLKTLLPDEKNTILFAGFQAAGTRGEALLHGADKIKIHGQYYPVRASIEYIENLSAHADINELIQWVAHLKKMPEKFFLTHGEPGACESLRKRLAQEFGVEAYIPQLGEKLHLAY